MKSLYNNHIVKLISGQIKNSNDSLRKNNFITFSLNLHEDEMRAIDKLFLPKGNGGIVINYYGGSETELCKELRNSLNVIKGNDKDTIDALVDLVSRTTIGYLYGMHYESVWLSARITPPDDSYVIPRWHADGLYYQTQMPAYKLVVALKGSQTRFAKIIDKERFEALSKVSLENDEKKQDYEEWLKSDLDVRRLIDKTVKEIEISEYGEGVKGTPFFAHCF